MTVSSSASSTTPTFARGELAPRIRFPEFAGSGEWEVKRLGEVCRIRTGKKDANQGCSEGRYPFFTCAREHIYSETYSFDTEAILIAGNANTGAATYYKGKFEAYQRTYVLSDFKDVHTPYLFAILDARLQDDLKSQSQTSAMSYIRLPMLSNYPVSAPSTLCEQQKIADCLSSLDELIAAESQKLETFKVHKKGLMQELFPREGETVPRIRFPEFEGSGEWIDTDLINLASEKLSNGVFNNPSKVGSGYKLVNVSDMYIDGPINGEQLSLLEIPHDLFLRNKVEFGDIFFTRSSLVKEGIAHSNIYLDTENNVTFDGHLIRFRTNTELADPKFLHYALKITRSRDQLVARGKTATMTTIGQADVASTRIRYPSILEQKNVAGCLTSLDDRITAQAERIETLKEHKKGLMQQLFPVMEG